jgi:hypothetical protein
MSVTLAAPQERYGANRLAGDIGPGSNDPAALVDVYPGDIDELHTRLVQWFEDAEHTSREEREDANKARSYYDGYQWTKAEQDALAKRGQPEITINKIHSKVSLLCGLERKARTDPKAFPRTPQEEDRADAATQALRYIADNNDYSISRSVVFEEMLVEGYSGVELRLEDDGRGGADIRIEHVPWDRLFYDPHSRRPDFSDARYVGVVVWMDREQVTEMYPHADDVIEASFGTGSGVSFGSYNDRPENAVWSDNRRTRVRVVQCHWVSNGTWWQATYSKSGMLTDPVASPFKDRRGKSACSLLLQSAYIDRENRRYGMVKNLLSLQDEINKRRSKALHLLSVHQTIAEKGAVKDVDEARQELARPDGYLEVNAGMRFEVLPGGELAAGQFQLLQHATAEMQLSGPNAAMSGTESRELSGRAILAQQAGGATQNEPLADSLRWWSRRVYEMAWMAAREYWTGERWLRVTDDLGELRWVGLNHPVTLGEQMTKQIAQMPEQQRQAAMQQLQQAAANPQMQMQLQQVVDIENDITDLDVDITVAEGIDVPAMAAENFQTLVQLAGLQPGLIPPEVLIAASSLRDKDQLLAMMKQHAEAQAQKQQRMQPLIERNAVAEVSGKEAKAAADFALAKERGVNTVKGLHSMHSDFSAPPSGEPWVAPDAPSALGTAGGVPPLTPMDLAHQMADLHTKRADLEAKQAKAASDRASVVQKLAQAQATLNPPPPRPQQ